MASCLRGSDLLVRLGGDEFVVLLVDGDAGYATEVARRITDGLAAPFTVGDDDRHDQRKHRNRIRT